MSGLWTALLIALWGLTLLIGLLILGILRKIGLIHRKIDDLPTRDTGHFTQGLSIGSQAPDFTLPLVGGGRLSLNTFRGHTLLLAFVSPSCSPCKDFLPELNTFLGRLDRSARALIVSMGTMGENERLREELKLLPPVLVQDEMEVMTLYSTRSTPFVYLIDSEGVVRGHAIGTNREQMEQMLASVSERSLQWTS